MTNVWRRASTTIVASGAPVILALLTLSLQRAQNDRSMGPVLAIGVGCTVLSMLTFLPMALTAMPRGIFWPPRARSRRRRPPRQGRGSRSPGS